MKITLNVSGGFLVVMWIICLALIALLIFTTCKKQPTIVDPYNLSNNYEACYDKSKE